MSDSELTPKNKSAAAPEAIAVEAVVEAPGQEEQFLEFLKQRKGLIIGVCAVILAGIVGKGALEYMGAQKEKAIADEFAASDETAELEAFASAHADHPLGGVAALKLGDQAYAAGNYDEAVTRYESAAASIDLAALRGRARLGAAVAQLMRGDAGPGKTALVAVANDLTELKAVRAEAAYHLAVIAKVSGQTAEIGQYADQALTLDPQGLWGQRAMFLRMNLPIEPAAVAAEAGGAPAVVEPTATPAVNFPKAGS